MSALDYLKSYGTSDSSEDECRSMADGVPLDNDAGSEDKFAGFNDKDGNAGGDGIFQFPPKT